MPKNQIEILENGNLLITLPIVFKYAPSEGHLDLRQTAWYVLPQTGIMGGQHGT